MQFLKTVFWVLIAVLVVLFAVRNWTPVTLNLWTDIQAETKLPMLVFVGFVIGWLPTSSRHRRSEAAFEIAAPPERVFSIIANPTNWPLYVPEIEQALLAGPLAAGSRVTVRRRVDLRGLRGPRLTVPDTVETGAEIVSVEPSRRIVSRSLDIQATTTTELDSVPGGTRLTTMYDGVVPYRLALLGAVVEVWVTAGRRNVETLRSQQRLKELLEQP